MIKSILLLSALLASTCQVGPFPKPSPQPEPPSPWPDDPTPDGQADAAPAPPPPPPAADAGPMRPCEAACARYAFLKCKQAQPTPDGASCVDVCENVESSGVMSLGPDCVAHAARCEDADACAYAVKRHAPSH